MPPHIATENNVTEDLNTAISLKERIASWWASDDSHQLADKESPEFNHDQHIHVKLDEFSIERWSDDRVEIVELLWGKGNRLPGDDAFNMDLFNLVALNSKSKILDIAVGLGSCARMLAKSHFAHIDVIENYPNLLPHLIKNLEQEKLKPFISILNGNLNEVSLPDVKYDLIYGREAFFKIKNKQAVMEKIVDALTANGHFIFTDFVLERDASSYKIFKNWSAREKETVYPVSVATYKKIFKGFDMPLRAIEDYSEQYIHHVNKGWVRLKDYMQTHEFDDAFVDMMAQESDLWLSRVRALRSGKLKLVKFHVTF